MQRGRGSGGTREPVADVVHEPGVYDVDDDAVLFYGKMDSTRDDAGLVAVNLDFRSPCECRLRLPLDALGIGWEEPYRVVDLVRETEHGSRGPEYRVRLDPHDEPAFIFSIRR
jgi:starch synthase (maltosyl-transferring)